MLISVITHSITNTVADIVHQVTLIDGKNFVKGPRDMEAHSIHLIIFEIFIYLLLCKPTLIAKSKLQLVSIAFCLFRS